MFQVNSTNRYSFQVCDGPVRCFGIKRETVRSESLKPFAGIPGNPNCHGVSVSTLATQFGGIRNAAQALGFASVKDLQNAIRTFCGN